MNTFLWFIYGLAISFLVFGLKKGLGPLLVFRGNLESLSFLFGLLILGFAFAKTSGLFSKKENKVLSNDFDEEFHNDFSKVGSGTDIKEVMPEDHTLGTKAQGLPSELSKNIKKLESENE